MCGLIGYSGPEVDMMKFDLVAIANESRGEQSSGIAITGDEVFKSTERYFKLRNSLDFKEAFKEQETYNIMAHCRRKSVGVTSKAAAHPYVIEINDERSLILMHNGTIKNRHDLARHYDLWLTDFETDSHLLAHLIANKKMDCLSYYTGGAALVWKYTDEPGVLYVFKGASQEESWTQGKKATYWVDERTLFYVHNDNGIYISSLSEPLSIISNDAKIRTFPQNTIVKIKDGKISTRKKIEKKNLPVRVVKTTKNDSNRHAGADDYKRSYNHVNNHSKKATPSASSQTSDSSFLAIDALPIKSSLGKATWFKGRYYKDGHLLEGTHILNEDGRLDVDGNEYYFYRGYLMKSKIDMEIVGDAKLNEFQLANNLFKLLKASVHPDCIVFNANKRAYRNEILATGLKIKVPFCNEFELDFNEGKFRGYVKTIDSSKEKKESKMTYRKLYTKIHNVVDSAISEMHNMATEDGYDEHYKKKICFLYNLVTDEDVFKLALEKYANESVNG